MTDVSTDLLQPLPTPAVLPIPLAGVILQMLQPPTFPAPTEDEPLPLEDDDHIWLR